MDNLLNNPNQVNDLIQSLWAMTLAYAPQLLLAIATLIIGLWLINKVLGTLETRMHSKVDATLFKFVNSLASIGLKTLLLISVASMVGVETTSFIAVLGAAGLAVGLALQGSLSNFAGGVLILIFKPFKVGDVIEAAGYIGAVKEIQIFVTVLTTPDNRRVIIPNGVLSNNSLINITAEPTRRVDMLFGISYGDDMKKAKAVLEQVTSEDARVLKDQDKTIAVHSLGDSSVNLVCRVWVKKEDYWGVYFDTHEKVKEAFDTAGITIPFPQQDVHMHQVS
ncbi:MAG: mechanosensitive ion channel [Hahellaceae bacterium]|nr:mechanosensitive ion channel [Hahellaceae bacterium]MCP5170533.1 mechanosensitive ion channel [Hahellaceae bacterium]